MKNQYDPRTDTKQGTKKALNSSYSVLFRGSFPWSLPMSTIFPRPAKGNAKGDILMRNKSLFVLFVAVSALFINSQNVHSQSPGTDEKKFEVGGQFSVVRSSISEARLTGVRCITIPCPTIVISKSREIQPGFGGRIGYNLSSNVAVEAELNFFPGADSFRVPDAFKGGHKIEGLVGAKIGKRFDKVGIFGKARPGFLTASKGDLRPRRDVFCIAMVNIFPPPAGCFETISKTSFAFDVGGVFEVYPTKRTVIRFDAADTIVRLSERNVSGVLNPPPGVLAPSILIVIRSPAETTHNFQGSIGIAFRF